MNAAETIRQAMSEVAALRDLAAQQPPLQVQLHWLKRLQSRRFVGTYGDLLASPRYRKAAVFFLEELYGERDYTLRDAQFSRIAKALQSYFPVSVVETAVTLARLHALTEALDFELAKVAAQIPAASPSGEAERYVQCWRQVGREVDRMTQLSEVLAMGAELDRLTRIRGLRLALRMMRTPARAAGLDALQQFLEAGFDTFAEMAHQSDATQEFLSTIASRERQWIQDLYLAPQAAAQEKLERCLQTA